MNTFTAVCIGIVLVVFGLVALVVGAISKVGVEMGRARAIAEAMGFTVQAAMRETPTISNDGKTLLSLEREKCVQYILTVENEGSGDWDMLQRFPDPPQLPNGYVATGPGATPEMIESLKPLAEAFTGDYYEFERRGNTLSVFWWETSDTQKVEKLHRMLTALA